MLRVEVIQQLSPGDALVAEWSALAQACPTATVFQTPEWLLPWRERFLPRDASAVLHLVTIRDLGERPKGEASGPAATAADEPPGELVGLIPLMRARWWSGFPVSRLVFLGRGVSDYNDLIAAPGREEAVCAAFYAALRRMTGWSVLDLRELREGALLRQCPPPRASGLAHSDWFLEPCPYLDLPAELPREQRWDGLLAGYSKKSRSNINYYERTLRRTYAVAEGAVASPDELPAAFEALFELHRRRWNRRWLPGVFTSPRLRAFHVAAARALLERGWLRLHLLRLDGEVQAALYAFAFHDRTCYYQGGFEPELARYSLGSVLIAAAMRQALDEGYPVFDFLRGNESYKQKWTGGKQRRNVRRLITRGGGAGLLAAEQLHRLEYGVEQQGKALLAGGLRKRAPQGAGGGK